MAEALHAAAINSNGDAISADRLRKDTNSFIQQSVRIQRSIDLVEPWVRGSRAGFTHMRQLANASLEVAHRIDRYMPVDTKVIDGQTAVLEASIKELHDEFH